MNRFFILPLLVAFCFGLFATPSSWSDEGSDAASSTDFEQAVRQASEAFAKAYNAGDAKALAQLFVARGEFIDVARIVYQGRAAIEAEFDASFKAASGTAIHVKIDSIRQVAPTIAIEDGQVTVARSNGPAFVSQYIAVHILENDTWKLASLRDLSATPLTTGENLLALEWLIGDWVSESADGVVEHCFYWAENGNFILGNFDIRVDGELVASGNQRIGWDPQTKQIRAWIFDADGSHLESTWTQLEDRWMVKVTGITPDGKTGSATDYYVPGDGKQIVWMSKDRVIDGVPGKDIEMKLVHKPPTPAIGEPGNGPPDKNE